MPEPIKHSLIAWCVFFAGLAVYEAFAIWKHDGSTLSEGVIYAVATFPRNGLVYIGIAIGWLIGHFFSQLREVYKARQKNGID